MQRNHGTCIARDGRTPAIRRPHRDADASGHLQKLHAVCPAATRNALQFRSETAANDDAPGLTRSPGNASQPNCRSRLDHESLLQGRLRSATSVVHLLINSLGKNTMSKKSLIATAVGTAFCCNPGGAGRFGCRKPFRPVQPWHPAIGWPRRKHRAKANGWQGQVRQHEHDQQRIGKCGMSMADTNKDGKISKEECDAHASHVHPNGHQQGWGHRQVRNGQDDGRHVRGENEARHVRRSQVSD